MRFILVLFALLIGLTSIGHAQSVPTISLGKAAVALNGPWYFRMGDDPTWAQPNLSESGWEVIDLTPPPESHDGDVGLKNYVAGWEARGHAGYRGFAWYRCNVAVDAARPLWLVGPASVDSAYEIYFNGRLLGGIGDLESSPPRVIAIQPRLYRIPDDAWNQTSSGTTALTGVVAIRVAMPAGMGGSSDTGGMHIVPWLGNEEGALAQFRYEWFQTIAGYAVDAVQPITLWFLALCSLGIFAFVQRDPFYVWFALSMGLLGLARFNQPMYFIGQWETIQMFVWGRLAIVDACTLGCWAFAWLLAFSRPNRYLRYGLIGLTIAYIALRIFSTRIVFPAISTSAVQTSALLLQLIRYAFIACVSYAAYRGIRRRSLVDAIGVVAMLIVSVGLFASEVGKLGIPGIWFPYGVGVSRTEWAYAVSFPLLFIYLYARVGKRLNRPGVPAA